MSVESHLGTCGVVIGIFRPDRLYRPRGFLNVCVRRNSAPTAAGTFFIININIFFTRGHVLVRREPHRSRSLWVGLSLGTVEIVSSKEPVRRRGMSALPGPSWPPTVFRGPLLFLASRKRFRATGPHSVRIHWRRDRTV